MLGADLFVSTRHPIIVTAKAMMVACGAWTISGNTVLYDPAMVRIVALKAPRSSLV